MEQAQPEMHEHSTFRLRRLGIDTHQEAVIYMRTDCHVCRAEGLSAQARVRVAHGGVSAVATLHHIAGDLLRPGEASLSEAAWKILGVQDGNMVTVAHAPPLDSLSHVRAKVYGRRLDEGALRAIVQDVAAGSYADVHLASFITACSGANLDRDEMVGLTKAMVEVGDRLRWEKAPIVDKHCIGGLPGNRTSPIVVAIAAACGLTMPKTSSRAITSPAGTADTMETLAPVDLDLPSIRRVVEREGGCIVWGGAVRLSPADDIFIRVERALDLDSEGQLVASVISKKVAAGSTHLVIDLPVGPTAKCRTRESADMLRSRLVEVARAFGIRAEVLITDGLQPVGRGIGPALEARDVLRVLQNEPDAPHDLRARAIALAGALLELVAAAPAGTGETAARAAIDDGRAWLKFQAICEAQGGMREPPRSRYMRPITAERAGRVAAIDNRLLAKVAKLAGAPDAKAAGLELHVALGKSVEIGEPLFTLHAETAGELAYAGDYLASGPMIFDVEPA
jgi:thymidine phosphorylase